MTVGANNVVVKEVGVGIVGCGTISSAYLKTLTGSPGVKVLALADLELARAQAQAKAFGVERAVTVDELLDIDEIGLVVDLTIPAAHWEVNQRALLAGKSVYSEKPLGVNHDQATALVRLAEERGLAIGSAPDTFLGAGLQTVARLLDAGEIGRPFQVEAHMVSRGPESWHHDPAFLFAPGAGPLYDIGPYYLTALVSLFGPIESVLADSNKAFEQRVIGSGPKAGQTFDVLVDTTFTLLLRFVSGVKATVLLTFDVSGSDLPKLEIFGTTGTLASPDPNIFGGTIRIRRHRDQPWQELPLGPGFSGEVRGLGALELLAAQRNGQRPRAAGELAAHVIEAMDGAVASAREGRRVMLTSRPERPRPVTEAEYTSYGWRAPVEKAG